MPEDNEVLTADEAALLRVSTKTVLSLARAGSRPERRWDALGAS